MFPARAIRKSDWRLHSEAPNWVFGIRHHSGLLRWIQFTQAFTASKTDICRALQMSFWNWSILKCVKKFEMRFFRCVEQGNDYQAEFKVFTAGGAEHIGAILMENVSPTSQGTPVKVIGIGMDTTERKRMEQRSRRIKNLKLLGRLAGGIAHDFNNLLTVVIGHADLLASEMDLHSIRESAEQISQAQRARVHWCDNCWSSAAHGLKSQR